MPKSPILTKGLPSAKPSNVGVVKTSKKPTKFKAGTNLEKVTR